MFEELEYNSYEPDMDTLMEHSFKFCGYYFPIQQSVKDRYCNMMKFWEKMKTNKNDWQVLQLIVNLEKYFLQMIFYKLSDRKDEKIINDYSCKT